MSVSQVIHWLISERNGHLTATFLIFIAVQLLFARLYLALYNRRSENFAFNVEIQKAQLATTESSTRRLLSNCQTASEILFEAKSQLEVAAIFRDLKDSKEIVLPSGNQCEIHVYTAVGPTGAGISYFLEIKTSAGLELHSNGVAGVPKTATDWLKEIDKASKRLTTKLNLYNDRLASLSTQTPDIWSFWDFLYFSTIVQTTVGFGDILPNSTAVRMIVTCQIMIGYALLVVVLNSVLG